MTMRRRHDGLPGRPSGRFAFLLCLLVLAIPATAAPADPAGEWAGTLVATQGTCPDRAPSRLLVSGTDVSFVPAGGVLVLHGQRRPGPRLHAQLLLTDMNRHPLPMVFEGALAPDGSRIDGTYGTPSCRAHVALLRPLNHPLQRLLGH